MTDLGTLYLTDTRDRMRGVKELGDGALAQLAPEDWHRALSPEGNSAAVLVQHLAGNMQSRWGALQVGYREGVDGEAAARDRDAEFGEGGQSAGELLACWPSGKEAGPSSWRRWAP